jgi:hypothetical protein
MARGSCAHRHIASRKGAQRPATGPAIESRRATGAVPPVTATAQSDHAASAAARDCSGRTGGGGREARRLLVEGPQQRSEQDTRQCPAPVQPEPAQEHHRRDGDPGRGADGERQRREQIDERVKRQTGREQPPPRPLQATGHEWRRRRGPRKRHGEPHAPREAARSSGPRRRSGSAPRRGRSPPGGGLP